MAGILSVRVSNAERKKLLELRAARGCKSVSDVIRLLCGFPRQPEHEGIEGADDIESVDALAHVVLRLVARIEDMSKVLHAIAMKEGIKHAGHQPVDHLAVPIAEMPLYEYRNGHKDPALPEGFHRG